MLAVMFEGYVLTKLWLWFVVPTFHQQPLGLAQAIGIALVVSLLTHQTCGDDDKEWSTGEQLRRAALALFLRPVIMLVAGWVAAWFM